VHITRVTPTIQRAMGDLTKAARRCIMGVT
jgi:hypothetical protein